MGQLPATAAGLFYQLNSCVKPSLTQRGISAIVNDGHFKCPFKKFYTAVNVAHIKRGMVQFDCPLRSLRL